jgi:hypothetical protein
MDDFFDNPLGLDPLSPPPSRDPRWFIPAHAAGSSRTASLSGRQTAIAQSAAPIPAPREVFPTWRRAQLEVDRLAGEALLAPRVLRTTGFLRPELAQRVADWFTGIPAAPAGAVRRSYRALERETARLFEIVHRAPSSGGLGVRVYYVRNDGDPHHDAVELCAELRAHGSMTLTTIATEAPHPLLGGQEGGVVDQFRVVHDVFGHAALGVGFDLQSEFATWLQCRTLFSADARGAAFCELVGATTTHILTGEKPGLRADLPPAELVAACDVDGRSGGSRGGEGATMNGRASMNEAATDSASNEHGARPWHA